MQHAAPRSVAVRLSARTQRSARYSPVRRCPRRARRRCAECSAQMPCAAHAERTALESNSNGFYETCARSMCVCRFVLADQPMKTSALRTRAALVCHLDPVRVGRAAVLGTALDRAEVHLQLAVDAERVAVHHRVVTGRVGDGLLDGDGRLRLSALLACACSHKMGATSALASCAWLHSDTMSCSRSVR